MQKNFSGLRDRDDFIECFDLIKAFDSDLRQRLVNHASTKVLSNVLLEIELLEAVAILKMMNTKRRLKTIKSLKNKDFEADLLRYIGNVQELECKAKFKKIAIVITETGKACSFCARKLQIWETVRLWSSGSTFCASHPEHVIEQSEWGCCNETSERRSRHDYYRLAYSD